MLPLEIVLTYARSAIEAILLSKSTDELTRYYLHC